MDIEAEDSQFTWGDSVTIRKNSPAKFHPGEFASVCGFYKVQSQEIAKELECEIDDWAYTIEFGDGSDIQVAERYLDKDLGIIQGKELSEYCDCFVGGICFDFKIDLNYSEIKINSEKFSRSVSGNLIISSEGFFSGKLIVPQIREIIIRNSSLSMGLKEKGTILEFEVSDDFLNLLIEWMPKKNTSLRIKAGQIWWEQR